MQKMIFFFLLIALGSCKKENKIKSDIVGTWEFDKFIGYPFNQPALPAGNGRIIVLEEDGGFERRQHDTLLFRGTYALRTKKDCYDRGGNDLIISTTEGSSNNYQYVEIYNGELSLSTPNCYQDGGTVYYRKIK